MKKLGIFLSIFVIILSIFSPLTASAAYNSSYEVDAGIVYIVSLDNDEVIFDKNYDKKTAPASLTKIMTALLVLENCPDLSVKTTVSQNAIDSLMNTGSSVAGLIPGEEISLMDLLYCVMVKSANEACIVLAEHVSGSESEFVKLMNKRAEELGCTNTHFSNAHGLDDEACYTTARDVYVMTKKALEFPIFEKICGTSRYTLAQTNLSEPRTLYATNLMMNAAYNLYYLPYVSGVKTGTTENAGQCIVTKASKDGYTYLAIVMGAKEKDLDGDGQTDNTAFADCKKLLEWIYNNIEYKVVAEEDQTITVVDVKYAWSTDHVRLVPEKEVSALVPSQLDVSSVYIEIDESVTPKVMKAPVKKGEVVGSAKIYYAGKEIASINLVPANDIKHSLLIHVVKLIGDAWSYPLGKVVMIIIILLILAYILLTYLINKDVIRKKKKKYE